MLWKKSSLGIQSLNRDWHWVAVEMEPGMESGRALVEHSWEEVREKALNKD